MAKTAADVTATGIESFRQRLRERAKRADPARKARLAHARAVALRAAQVLRERFGVTRVVLFGSCLHEEWLTPWSDVDLAAWGIRPEDTFRAMGAVRGLDRSLEVDLIDVAACSPALLAAIEAEGQELWPSGRDWHEALLQQMAAERLPDRPAVIAEATREALEEYLRFRHVVRNIYAFEFDSERVGRLVERLEEGFGRARRDLLSFADFLERVASGDGAA